MDLASLMTDLPHGMLVTDPDLIERYGRDVTGRFVHPPAAVARPASVDDLATLMRQCNERRIAVVPQGGNTGLVGGAIPLRDELVVSLERFARLDPVQKDLTVIAGAGVTLGSVQQRAATAQAEFPLDFAARGSATVGGMVATDAGGELTLRHGTMADRVRGLQAVLADGTVIDQLDGTNPPNQPDLLRLLPGSEGAVAIVCAARLQLVPSPARRVAALVGSPSLRSAAEVAERLSTDAPSVEAIDFFLAQGLDLVVEHAGLPQPFESRYAAYLVVSAAGADAVEEELAAALNAAPDVGDVAVAQTSTQRHDLWAYRELHNAAVNAAGVPHKLDVAVAPLEVPVMIERVDAWLSERFPAARAIHYGHLGTGNVHINILGPPPEDRTVEEGVLEIVADLGGNFAAEHGIGQAKTRWLHLAPPARIDRLVVIKRELDPNGILNPGKLLPTAP